MTTIEQLQAELSERHKLLVRYQKVSVVLERAGLSPNTYNDAVTGKSSVLVPTMDRILTAQNQVIDEYEEELRKKHIKKSVTA
ncbi:hypothetical protein [Runella sp.]|uniref:hypothetical protein n=1 Tax=Runella sp. TaxID=1960881 RepID=UPI003D1490FD